MAARASVVRARPVRTPRADDDAQPQVGRLLGFDAAGQLLVEVPGVGGRVVARSLLRVDRALRHAVLKQREVLLLFEMGDPRKPIVAGILQPTAAEPAATEVEALASPAPATNSALVLEADVDGRRVKLSAQDEIVLECGESSITLRRNGRVIIRGVQVDSLASGTQRIRGGQVRLN
jgi:hypothetical protein